MKYSKSLVAAILIMNSGSYLNAAHYNAPTAYYEEPSDLAIVTQIHRISNITQADVDKINLVPFGKLQNVAALGLGTYPTYKTFTTIPQFMEKLGTYGPTESNKFWFALAGATAVAFGAYKTLYPRTESGILEMVKAYVNMCNNLQVVNSYYQMWDQLNNLGSKPGNSAWAGSNIARKKGIDDLLEQGRVALLLLDDVNNTAEVQKLRTRITEIITNLNWNSRLIEQMANMELQDRANRISRNIAGAQQVAQLALQKEQASALRYGKISLAFTAMSNFIQKSMETMVYAYEHKTEIAATIGAGSIAIYALLSYVQAKLGFGQ